MYVDVGGRNVEIAQQRQFRVIFQFAGEKFGQCGQPIEFVHEFITVQRLTVDDVGIDNAHTIDGGADHALLFIFKIWQVLLHLGLCRAADDGDTVVGFLPDEADVQTCIGKGLLWKDFIGHFGFLQTQHVGVGGIHIVQHLRQANFERIDIPSSDFHIFILKHTAVIMPKNHSLNMNDIVMSLSRNCHIDEI